MFVCVCACVRTENYGQIEMRRWRGMRQRLPLSRHLRVVRLGRLDMARSSCI